MFEPLPGDVNRASRARALAHLAEHEVDVLVIGGGVTGAGIALDAATRGLSTALVEAKDPASGTSGFSSKLVHGGLRYLAQGDVALAWESAVEREALMRRIAPHLVTPTAFLVPRFAHHRGGEDAAVRDGRAAQPPGSGADPGTETGTDASPGAAGRSPLDGRLGDALSETGIRIADAFRAASGLPDRVLPKPKRVSAREALLLAPTLKEDGLRGGLVYWDGAVEDDTRLVVALARTAARHGAHIVTGCRVAQATDREALVVADDGAGNPSGEGTEFHVRARAVINATGVWAAELTPAVDLAPSRGTHLVFRSEVFGNPRAVITAPVPGHFGRYVFVLPQANGLSYLGLTDEPALGADGYAPGVPEADIDFLLEVASESLAVPLTRADMLSAYSGLRPLVRSVSRTGGVSERPSASASRQHLVLDAPGRPITVTGGKLTVYRKMAEDAVDAAVRRLGRSPAELPAVTKRVPLIGSPGSEHGPRGAAAARRRPSPAAALRESARAASAVWPVSDGATVSRLARVYGWEAERVAALAAVHPELAAEVAPGAGITRAEFAFGILAEGAATSADLLARRTRLALDPRLAADAEATAEQLLDRFA
ncbi:FAD-dependent oxidoreductase [Leucobacter sp. NPDC015123]|uniref:glycerol-3-phosphate dehydrogenase/oxidase n=1 Tax=Leucobacter sp. NPDC015123 TaxID=3364129 RepID=UPI0036F46989